MAVSVALPTPWRRGRRGAMVPGTVDCALTLSSRVVSLLREGVHRVPQACGRPLANTHRYQPIEPTIRRRPRHKHRGRPEIGGGWIMGHRVTHPLPHLGRDPGEAPGGHANTMAIIGKEGEPHIRRPLPSRPEAAGFLPPRAYHPSERRPRKTTLLERAQQPRAAWLGSSWRS